MSSTESWLSQEDIQGHGDDSDGRQINPAPIIEGDLETAESITVVFPDGEEPVTMSRRDFVRLSSSAAATGALVATAGCQIPTEHVVPYADRPDGLAPGKPLYYNSTGAGGSGTPIRIKCREGRPIHIEANSEHPLSGGGITAQDGAAILDLYDPQRGTGPAQVAAGKASASDWGTLDAAVAKALVGSKGKVVFLTSSQHGAALTEAFDELNAAFGARHVQFEATGATALLDAAKACYGVAKAPDYRLAAARVIVGFGAEFLDTFLSPARFQADWAAGRQVDEFGEKMARTIVFESRLTVTGANADRRHRVAHQHYEDIALAIAARVAKGAGNNDIAQRLSGFTPEAVASNSGLSQAAIEKAADDLLAHKGESLAIAGGVASTTGLEVAVNIINELLGNNGKTVNPGANNQAAGGLSSLKALTDDINAGKVSTLVVLGANPVLAGGALGFGTALAKVGTVIVANDRLDETGSKANWYAPLAHHLESWADSNPVDGIHSVQQPAINPMHDSRSFLDHLIAWGTAAGIGGRILTASAKAKKSGINRPSYHFIQDVWNHRLLRRASQSSLDRAFQEVLRTGFHDEGHSSSTPSLNRTVLKTLPKSPGATEISGMLQLMLVPSVTMGGGTGVQANNGWLQELADPISKVVWDNCLYISMADARSGELSGIQDGDLVELVTDSGKVKVPILIQPGMAPGTASLALGYGRTAVGDVGNEVGVDGFALSSATGSLLVSANVGRSSGHRQLARIQGEDFNNNLMRPLSPEATLEAWKAKQGISAKTADHGNSHDKGHGDDKAAGDDKAHGADHHGDHGGDHGGGHGIPTHWYAHGKVGYESHGDHKLFKGGMPGPSLWGGHKYTSYRWGMTIDTNTCTGCSACVIACQSENNVPVVGRKGVLSNREMNWLRIDRYYSFDTQADDAGAEPKYAKWDYLSPKPDDAWDNPKTHVQPMLCQHCENAGCESVCPFTATMHDEEGVNQQVYNRCVGTRYCANNCAYKVRRYNWFEYGFNRQNWLADMVNTEGPKQRRYNQVEPLPMRFNPEVTIRTRGVMEKCSFCTQRISAAKQGAEDEGRRLQDADLQTACQAACPSNAISFGDMNNPESAVAKGLQDSRSYRLLEEVGAKPSVFYMARIWNV